MTDEQTPGEQTPDPIQPMSGQQPPPSDAPPPPPVNPYDQQPVTPDPAAAPAPPPYGQPQQPAYGQPQYSQPQYGQPGMPPGFPAAPVESKPSRALAITALILALLICIPFLTAGVALVLGLVVLLTKRPGKGLAIGAMVISVLAIIGWIAAVIGLANYDWDKLLPVEQLKTGECLNATNLTDADEDFVEDIEEVSCADPHDAEVLVTKELTQDDAESYDPASSSLCTDLITGAGLEGKLSEDVGYFGLTSESSPNAGDKLVCIAYRVDGTKLDAPL